MIRLYLNRYMQAGMFAGRKVLNIGCGAGGKSPYYVRLGAIVTGIDLVPTCADEVRCANNLAADTANSFCSSRLTPQNCLSRMPPSTRSY